MLILTFFSQIIKSWCVICPRSYTKWKQTNWVMQQMVTINKSLHQLEKYPVVKTHRCLIISEPEK